MQQRGGDNEATGFRGDKSKHAEEKLGERRPNDFELPIYCVLVF